MALIVAKWVPLVLTYRGANVVYGKMMRIVQTAVKTTNAMEAGVGIRKGEELYHEATYP